MGTEPDLGIALGMGKKRSERGNVFVCLLQCLLIYILFERCSACMYECALHVSNACEDQKRVSDPFGTGVPDGHEPPFGC